MASVTGRSVRLPTPGLRTGRCACAPRPPSKMTAHAASNAAADSNTRARFIYKGPSEVMLRRPRVYFILLVALWAVPASGQGHQMGDGFVAIRAGANLIGNTYRVRERKPEPGAGGSIGTFL